MEQGPDRPVVIVIGGPNGAGKSTLASALIPPEMTFVNADEVAKELRGGSDVNVDVAAGRQVLRQLDQLEAARQSFAIETTLASRSLAPRLRRLIHSGYEFRLYFVWVPSPEFSISRVADRVALGGHHIPEDVIRRRYPRGIANFMRVYRPMAHRWRLYDNSGLRVPRLLATGRPVGRASIRDVDLWNSIVRQIDDDGHNR